MELRIGDTVYDNKAPYEYVGEIGNDYRLLNKHLMELGYGAFNCNDLCEFWKDISDDYGAGWLIVPKNIEEFKSIIGYEEE